MTALYAADWIEQPDGSYHFYAILPTTAQGVGHAWVFPEQAILADEELGFSETTPVMDIIRHVLIDFVQKGRSEMTQWNLDEVTDADLATLPNHPKPEQLQAHRDQRRATRVQSITQDILTRRDYGGID